jgi:hypothetical protein
MSIRAVNATEKARFLTPQRSRAMPAMSGSNADSFIAAAPSLQCSIGAAPGLASQDGR